MSQGGQNSGNAYSRAADALTTAGTATGNAMTMYGNLPSIAAGMETYQNPFTQQVIDRSMADLSRTTAMQQEANRASAARAGAFGGSRHGLVEAETNASAQRNMGDLAANLRARGFDTAAQLANQDISNRLSGAGGLLSAAGTMQGLGTTGFNMADTLQNRQWQQGEAARGLRDRQLADAMEQFYGFAGSPTNFLDLMTGAASGSPLANQGTSTTGYTPGLLGLISGIAGIGSLF